MAADARRRVEQGAPTCARCWRTCGRTRASSCCSRAASSGRSASGPSSARWTGTCSTTRCTAASRRWSGDLNRAYRAQSALWTRDATPEGFSWIDANDSSGNVLSFLRHGVDADGRPTVMACIANFSGSPKPDYRVGLPFAGRWREVLNTDATSYGGSGWGNYGGGRRRAVRVARAARVGRAPTAALRGAVARAGAVRGCGPAVRCRSGWRPPPPRPTRPRPARSPRWRLPSPRPPTTSPWHRQEGPRPDLSPRRLISRKSRPPRRRVCRSPRRRSNRPPR